MKQPYDEGLTLSRLMTFWRNSGQTETGIFLGSRPLTNSRRFAEIFICWIRNRKEFR